MKTLIFDTYADFSNRADQVVNGKSNSQPTKKNEIRRTIQNVGS